MEHIAASLYNSDPDSDADSTRTEDYSIENVSDKHVSDVLEDLDDVAVNSIENTNEQSNGVEFPGMEIPDNPEIDQMDLLKENSYSKNSELVTEFNYTLENSNENMEGLSSICTVSDKREAAGDITGNKYFSGKKPSDSADSVESRQGTVYRTDLSDSIDNDISHLKPDNDSLQESLDGKERLVKLGFFYIE